MFFLLPGVRAADTDTVEATVKVQHISINISSDGSIDYGALAVGTSATTATGDGDNIDDTQTATNDGNVTEDFDIKGQDTASWALDTTTGADQYVHEFCTSNCDSSPTWTPLTTSYDTLATGIGASNTQDFDLRIQVPTSTTDYNAQSVDVTVLATASS